MHNLPFPLYNSAVTLVPSEGVSEPLDLNTGNWIWATDALAEQLTKADLFIQNHRNHTLLTKTLKVQ